MRIGFTAPWLATTFSATLLATTAPVAAETFNRIATWPVFANLSATTADAITAAEILSATRDGETLLYTDSERGAIGFVDITDPAAPSGDGSVLLAGEPTSVTVGADAAFIAVNTSPDFINPAGHVTVLDLATRTVAQRCDVGGQPDAIAISPDNAFLAVAVENERDEDLNDGALPQAPAGHLAIFSLGGGTIANCNAVTTVDLTGLAAESGDDPEPEFVAINGANQAVVTLQENNHIALVDLASAALIGDFTAGTVSLTHVDAVEDGIIDPTASLADLPREPDAVAWLDDTRFVTANEGDFKGGSRGFTVFNFDGTVAFDSASSLEHLATSVGHYPEGRSENKGAEPEGVAVAEFAGDSLIFVGLERANLLAVYTAGGATPALLQVLPTGIGPEGILPIPSRNLLAVANEVDEPEDGIRSTISLYEFNGDGAAYPTIVSDDVGGAPIGWGALSGLAADPADPSRLYAVHDSFYDAARIYTVDVSSQPARIVASQPLVRNGSPVNYDLEGIAVAHDGGFWLVSEGNPNNQRPNLLIKAAVNGAIEREIELPEAVAASAVRFGFEGVTVRGSGADEEVLIAIQRPWQNDPGGHARIAGYSPATDSWAFALYPLDAPESAAGGWVGLSELVTLDDGAVAVLERDNRGGPDAAVKRIYVFDTAKLDGSADQPVMLTKTLAADLLDNLAATAGWVPDKPEGMAVAADGSVYLVTDNDGIDDATGETLFLRLGDADEMFAGN